MLSLPVISWGQTCKGQWRSKEQAHMYPAAVLIILSACSTVNASGSSSFLGGFVICRSGFLSPQTLPAPHSKKWCKAFQSPSLVVDETSHVSSQIRRSRSSMLTSLTSLPRSANDPGRTLYSLVPLPSKTQGYSDLSDVVFALALLLLPFEMLQASVM